MRSYGSWPSLHDDSTRRMRLLTAPGRLTQMETGLIVVWSIVAGIASFGLLIAASQHPPGANPRWWWGLAVMLCYGPLVGVDHEDQTGKIHYLRSLVGIGVATALWVVARVSVLWEELQRLRKFERHVLEEPARRKAEEERERARQLGQAAHAAAVAAFDAVNSESYADEDAGDHARRWEQAFQNVLKTDPNRVR